MFTLSANITIDENESLLEDFVALPAYGKPLNSNHIRSLESYGVLVHSVDLCGIVIRNRFNNVGVVLNHRIGRVTAKIPRKLKKKLRRTDANNNGGIVPFSWKEFCNHVFRRVVNTKMDIRSTQMHDAALEQLCKSEDNAFLDLCKRAGELVV